MNCAVQHHWEKLYKIPSMMKTEYGKKRAEELWEFMCHFREEYNKQADIQHVLDLEWVRRSLGGI
jgi:uncharacterized protein